MARNQFSAQDLIEEEEVIDDIDAMEEVIPFRHDITAYGADFTVDSLVARLERGDIIIPSFDPPTPRPGSGSGVTPFQRKEVWTKTQKDRFIESLLLGFPVPGIFLVAEPDGTFLVLDGQQRLRAIWDYYKQKGQGSSLSKVLEDYRGLSYKSLPDLSRRTLDSSLIHATVVQENTPTEDKASIYQIFERLNTGGTQLNPQEIRVALYSGKFAELLRQLNTNKHWRELYGPVSKRFKDQELILRCLGMYETGCEYKSPMKGFLNNYMSDNRNMDDSRIAELQYIFENTIEQIYKDIGKRAFRPYTPYLNAAVLESIFVGVADRLSHGPITDPNGFVHAFEQLVSYKEYGSAVETATANEPNVRTRLRLSRQSFASVE